MVIWHALNGRRRISPSGQSCKGRFFGRRGFNQLFGNYFLFTHPATASRSLRMTCISQLSDHDAVTKIHLSHKNGSFKMTMTGAENAKKR